MPRVNRLPGISIVASLLLALSASVAAGQAAQDDAANKKEARELAEAIEACDKGASAPLDFTAKAPPVQYVELVPYNLDLTGLKTLQGLCQAAWVGKPDQPRLQLQWLRVTMAIGEANLKLLTPQVRKLAEGGSAEAKFLLFVLYRTHQGGGESTMMDVSRPEAFKALIEAGDQGHMGAMNELMDLYGGSVQTTRDLKEAVRWARRLESAPPQGRETTRWEDTMRAAVPLEIARITLMEEGFSATENRAAFKLAERVMKAGGQDENAAARVVVRALRAGRGVSKDPTRARGLLEDLVKTDTTLVSTLAEMLARGEGGPEDGKRALALVRAPDRQYDARARSVEAEILLAGKVIGYRPQEAIKALSGSYDPDDHIRLAGLLIDYHPRLDRGESFVSSMSSYASSRNDVALALAKLKLSDNSQFSDDDGARVLLKPLVDGGDREALWLYAGTQYRNLGSTSYRPMRREDGLSDAELMALVDEGIRREEPEAFLLKA